MLGALIIVFREVIEAGLIVGIVMAATRGVLGRGRWVSVGVGAGVLGATIVAIFAGAISQAFEGAGQELFNASVLGIAVVMLMWHNAWMARHGREIAAEMRDIGTAVSEGAKPLTALAIVVGLAVLREGS
ncbi:MAG TPA: FTR1 family protein, partial [Pseudolabrys sp.]|nr:FTR1 family protein [Pseudolabrys sp.]